MDKTTVELSKQEINIIRNGMNLILSLDKIENMLSDTSKSHYSSVKKKFDKISDSY